MATFADYAHATSTTMPAPKNRRHSQQKHNPYKGLTYTLMDELMASEKQAMPKASQHYQVERFRAALTALERAPTPSVTDWRIVSDAVNLMETLIKEGPWPMLGGGVGEVEDGRGLLMDAITALAIAGARHQQEGKPIRLDGPGMLALRGLVEDYAEILAALPHRTMILAHRKTEKRMRDIFQGKRKPHDVEVVSL